MQVGTPLLRCPQRNISGGHPSAGVPTHFFFRRNQNSPLLFWYRWCIITQVKRAGVMELGSEPTAASGGVKGGERVAAVKIS